MRFVSNPFRRKYADGGSIKPRSVGDGPWARMSPPAVLCGHKGCDWGVEGEDPRQLWLELSAHEREPHPNPYV